MKGRNREILFINTNRYMNPPVVPLGIEYLVHALKAHSFEVEVLDLCFSTDPIRGLDYAIKDFRPDALCLTIRNVDSVLYPDTDFFLPEIREMVAHIKSISSAPVVIGGSALPADPEGILNFVGADIAIAGPGEETLPALLKEETLIEKRGMVINGTGPESSCPERGGHISYRDYLAKDGLPGFETHKGCSWNCAYCVEAGSAVRFRSSSDIICELRQLVEQGYDHLHLCDPEFNEDLDYCLSLLDKINEERLGLRWGVYMRPGNYSSELFESLRRSGAYLVTLSVDTLRRGAAYWSDVETMVALCRKAGIRVSVDFLTGFPYEDDDTLKESLDFFRKAEPDEVVVNVFLRLYKSLKITSRILKDPDLRKFLITPEADRGSMLSPTFYNHVSAEKLREYIHRDRLFRIAGEEKGVNYQKA